MKAELKTLKCDKECSLNAEYKHRIISFITNKADEMIQALSYR